MVKFVVVSAMTVSTIDALREVYTSQQFLGHRHVMAPSAVAITERDDTGMQKLAIVMPEADLGDLKKVAETLSDAGRTIEEKIAVFSKILAGAADGVAEMHRKGFAHRDIKPENVFVKTNDGGQPEGLIGDFGISYHHSEFPGLGHGGTNPYIPFSDPTTGFSVDSYAFGMMAFHMFSGGEFPCIMGRGNPVLPSPAALKARIDGYLPAVSEAVKSLIHKALTAAPEERPTMLEWRDTLAAR